jgi:hypothetical protein
MRQPDTTPEHTYELVDWGTKWNHYKHVRVTTLTEFEAHELNHGFMMNQTTKRYVRRD